MRSTLSFKVDKAVESRSDEGDFLVLVAGKPDSQVVRFKYYQRYPLYMGKGSFHQTLEVARAVNGMRKYHRQEAN